MQITEQLLRRANEIIFVILFIIYLLLYAFWPAVSQFTTPAQAQLYAEHEVPMYDVHARRYNYEKDPFENTRNTKYDTYESTPTLNIANWFGETKKKITAKLTRKKSTKNQQTSSAVGCDGSTMSWTVPNGTDSIQVAIYDSNGAYRNSYTITNYISISPGQRLTIKANC